MNNRLLHAYNHLSITNHGLADAATVTLLMHSVAPKWSCWFKIWKISCWVDATLRGGIFRYIINFFVVLKNLLNIEFDSSEIDM